MAAFTEDHFLEYLLLHGPPVLSPRKRREKAKALRGERMDWVLDYLDYIDFIQVYCNERFGELAYDLSFSAEFITAYEKWFTQCVKNATTGETNYDQQERL